MNIDFNVSLKEWNYWISMGVYYGFKGRGYGKFAKGIPCSRQYRSKGKAR